MNILAIDLWGDLWGWFSDPASWQGDDGVWHRLGEHALLTVTALLIAALIGLPISLWLGHLGRGGVLAINVTNVRAGDPGDRAARYCRWASSGAPSQAIRAGRLGHPAHLDRLCPAPIVTSTLSGDAPGVDPDLVEAARGMGMSGAQSARGCGAAALPVIDLGDPAVVRCGRPPRSRPWLPAQAWAGSSCMAMTAKTAPK
ncbi:MAG: hypothetical protein R2693_01990 [Nocardioidaceae bacterium]